MIVHIYIMAYNEAILMPYLLRHYSTFADKIFVYDDGSDDGTREIVAGCPIAELRDLDCGNEMNDAKWRVFWSSIYKQSRGEADFVMLADADEFYYHKDMRSLLESYKAMGINMPLVSGYNMVSEAPPSNNYQIYDEIWNGYPYAPESKQCVFDPALDVSYGCGRHQIEYVMPIEAVRSTNTPEISLLHYAHMGVDYLMNRRLRWRERMSQANKDNGWGSYIFNDEDWHQGEHHEAVKLSQPLVGIIPGAGGKV